MVIVLISSLNLICRSESDRKWTHKALPKKAAKVLKVTLERLFDKLCQDTTDPGSPLDVGDMALDFDFTRRRKQVQDPIILF